MAWVLDLDGVIWLDDTPIDGSAGAVARLRAAGEHVVFITNNSWSPVAEVEAKLARHGIDGHGDVVTSAQATAQLVEPGERALLCGGPGLREALEARGVDVVDAAQVVGDADPGPYDAVTVGFHRDFDWDRMRVAATAVRLGARLLASNDDATYPMPGGPVPGCGSILASIERASGISAVVAGKPYQPMADLVRAALGDSGIVVGDRPDTDGRLAGVLGFRYGLVLSGVTRVGDLPISPAPDVVGDDLASLVAVEIG